MPLSAASLERAIELNGEAVAMNKAAFTWGRRAALDTARVEALVAPRSAPSGDKLVSTSLEETVKRRIAFLTDYQDKAYARRYRDRVEKVQAAEQAKALGSTALSEAVARYLFKLMAIKDEYEVARLYSNGEFMKALRSQFAGDPKLTFHLAPPILGKRDMATGLPVKTTFGPWMLRAFGLLAHGKRLRGTWLDIFGRTDERRTERQLIADYEALLDEIVDRLTPGNHALCVALASIPEKIRGFGHVKERHLVAAKAEEAALLARLREPESTPALAAE